MYRRSLSNLLGGSLLVATVAALNACGGEAAGGDMTTPSAGSTGMTSTSTTAGTPATMGTAGKTGAPTATGTAGTKAAAAGTMSSTSGVMTAAGKSGGAGTAATAGSGAAGSGMAAAAAGSTAAGAAGGMAAAAGGGAAGGAASSGGTLGGPLMYSGPFTMGMMIDAKYKCPSMGDNKSPPLKWTGGPADTKSFAIVLFDTTYMMLHWAIWDIPASVNELPEGLSAGYELMNPMGAHQAAQMCGMEPAYCGPCSGNAFLMAGTYEFRLYALKVDKLGLSESSTAAQAQSAIESMMLEKAVWKGVPVTMM